MNLRVSLAAALLVVLSGCASMTQIGRIQAEPNRYQNRDVKVRGTVGKSVGFIVAGGYTVEDETGRLTVISNQSVPPSGTVVEVTGRVQTGISIMGRNFGTTLRQRDMRVKVLAPKKP